MTDRHRTPIDGPAWIAWVNRSLAALEGMIRNARPVPIGAMVLFSGPTPPGWLPANGATVSAATYPILTDQLGSTTLPHPAAVSGVGWIIRAL